MKSIVILALLLNLSSAFARQRSVPPYHLLNPVPAGSLREMETDRPNVTESAFTVDAGHFQYETDLFRSEHVSSEEGKTSTLYLNQFLLKTGLVKNTELQAGFQTYGWQRSREQSGEIKHTDGVGNLIVRLKQNLTGNDGGKFVMAVLPYLRFPTSAIEKSRYEYGLIVPMQTELPGDWKLGFQIEADRLKDESSAGMHTEFLQSLTLSHEILKDLDGIAETYYSYDLKAHQWANYLNAALQVKIAQGVKLDGGVNYGLQHDARKSYFIGSSIRF
ncbi:transporter [Pedobacter sp. JY14-1]|uniref:transporter n=1 Tax=Pedobacter sp. JY14-1 TaxID=3034151 RepID=UPI0023E109FB|nr:transporter [Pedobacter sp. JY14-1]